MNIKVGSTVKIRRHGERFWCIVKKINDDNIIAVVDNDLITKKLKYRDTVRFRKSEYTRYMERLKYYTIL
jgi:hypothetical protein